MKNKTTIQERFSGYINLAVVLVMLTLSGFSGTPVSAPGVNILAKTGDIKVSGTSNLHDWTMETKDITCSAHFDFPSGDNAKPNLLTSLSLEIPIKNLKSGKSLMDTRAYKALKSGKFPAITFLLTSAVIVPSEKQPFQIKSNGDLTIAGITKPVYMNVGCLVNADRTITCTGSEKLKMSDYEIKPPAFMLGTLRTGDDLTIDFTVIFKM